MAWVFPGNYPVFYASISTYMVLLGIVCLCVCGGGGGVQQGLADCSTFIYMYYVSRSGDINLSVFSYHRQSQIELLLCKCGHERQHDDINSSKMGLLFTY